MKTWKRFGTSAGVATAVMMLLLVLYGIYEILASSGGLSREDRFTGLLYAIPLLLALALPVGAFVAGFSSAPDVFGAAEGRKARIGVLAIGGLLLAMLCLIILGYVSPLLDRAQGDPELLLHELPAAWRDALAEGATRPAGPMRWFDAGRLGWELFFRLFWSVMVGLMAGVGLLAGYWARWTTNRRLVALQAWAVGLVLAISVIIGLVLGNELAQQSGASLLGAWLLLRVPLLVFFVLSWPTWLSLRGPRRDEVVAPDGAAA